MDSYEEYSGLVSANLRRAVKTCAQAQRNEGDASIVFENPEEERQIALAYAQTYALLAIAEAIREGFAGMRRMD